mmetsp:Transcript_3703/g.8933  ORF Transcript_3703/g.8933 Transcript_3703/m.8933 type:complete len:203 (-) Transcript_3703:297-905(-)
MCHHDKRDRGILRRLRARTHLAAISCGMQPGSGAPALGGRGGADDIRDASLPLSGLRGTLAWIVQALRLLPQRSLHEWRCMQILSSLWPRGGPAPQEAKAGANEGGGALAKCPLRRCSPCCGVGMRAASFHCVFLHDLVRLDRIAVRLSTGFRWLAIHRQVHLGHCTGRCRIIRGGSCSSDFHPRATSASGNSHAEDRVCPS